MRKIEDAANSIDPHPNGLGRMAFLAGARYVLDQLTSENSVNIAFLVVADVRHHECERILAAVRKEIEGE